VIVFAGLGNPGRYYKLNRHNIGFMAIDYAAELLKIKNYKIDCKAMIMHALIENKDVFFMKPLTYMNNSGYALHNFSLTYKVEPRDFVVIHDDIYLPFGKIKIKLKSGDGGHKGMASIINYFATNEIPRIKIGIKGKNNIMSNEYADYVLSNFEKSELESLNEILDKVYQVMISIVTEGIAKAMNKFN
jgi:PTH1 family peptidyl-tRNA hydrolase